MDSLRAKLASKREEDPGMHEPDLRPSRVNDIFQKLKQRRLRKSDEDMVNKAVLPSAAFQLL